jgi:hypothetical protein
MFSVVLASACALSNEPGPRMGEVLSDQGWNRRARSLVLGHGESAGVDWLAMASRDDMGFVPPGEDATTWICTFTAVPGTELEEFPHMCLPPLVEGAVIGQTSTGGIQGVSFLHGIIDDQVATVMLQSDAFTAEAVAVPLEALGLPDKVFAITSPAPAAGYTLVAYDADGTELDRLAVGPAPTVPPNPPPLPIQP